MNGNEQYMDLISILSGRPAAEADVYGDSEHRDIKGIVRFYAAPRGTLVYARISGLPSPAGKCKSPVFGFHIHEGAECSGHDGGSFSHVMAHYNPGGCEHPHHAGDMPPLFGNGGFALSIFLTDRFTPDEVAGKTVIIHSDPDDFTTQPSGNSGQKIACGEIRALGRRRRRY
ncbi:MAG: superoxide dismutase family protein [Oscillospiraceae bacterium]